MATPHLLTRINHVEFSNLYARADNIGEVLAAEVMVDGVRTLLVSVYINPNPSTDDTEYFLLYNLTAYSPENCTMWPRLKRFGYFNTPIILTGDLNVNLRDRANYEHFRSFALEELGLTIVTDPPRSTTLSGSRIDIIYVRYVLHVRCTTYISYFTYHRPVFAITSQPHSDSVDTEHQHPQVPPSPQLPMIDYDDPQSSTSKTLF
jgi:hypothetical protein